MTVVAWVKGLADIDAPLVQLVRDQLRADLTEYEQASFGILLLRSIYPSSIRRIGALAVRAKTLILLGPDLRLAADAKWSLLAAGAADVLEWPGEKQIAAQILPRIERWTEVETLMRSDPAVHKLVGESAVWQNVLRDAVEIAIFSESAVLLTGESGTGKEQIARLTHALDRRPRKRDLVVVDCTTLSRELMGSELFGHERGAFTGAIAAHDGAIALARYGTLFLDEIGELELSLQAQLLRVIQERTFKRIGGNVWHQADFRLICATNRNLEHEVRGGRFRPDLYYRIADRTLHLPSLGARREDIPLLAKHFWRVSRISDEDPEFDPALGQYLMTREYPGNVRDLRRIVMALRDRHVGGGMVTVGALPESERPSAHVTDALDDDVSPLSQADPWSAPGFVSAIEAAIARGDGLREVSRAAAAAAIRLALDQEHGNLQRAARLLGVTDRALQARRKNGGAVSPT